MLLTSLCAAAVLSLSSVALQYFSPSLFRARAHRNEASLSEQSAQRTLDLVQQESARELARRPQYPYSIVSGGVHDVHELKYAVEHDPVVASHYAGFDYAHARVVRLLLERSVYVSYRIGNRVYWTRHKVKLRKGETLLTDGKMTARTRCANRVEEKPQQESSRMEPPAMVFDEPVMPAILPGLETAPVPFETALNRAPAGPALPLGIYDPIDGGNWIPLSPAPVPNVCAPVTKPTAKGSALEAVSAETGKAKKKGNVCGGGSTSEVPEPGTWLLVGSGLGALYWKARQRLTRA
jgi:hypothetical protein